MLGAIVGDIVGSVYEWNNIKTKSFPLFRDDCTFTDDTVMTCAVAQAIMDGGSRDAFVENLKRFGRMYPDVGYGSRFREWLLSDAQQPYHSYGNGSAMRVSPCGWVADCGVLARTGQWPVNGRNLARLSAQVTHDHPEGIKGALAVADAIYLCRYYFGGYFRENDSPLQSDPAEYKGKIQTYLEAEYGYDLSRPLSAIRPGYTFDVSCQGSVPQAIRAFLESSDFEDAIRNAVSLGGDSDTIAAMAGSIAQAAYGIPGEIEEKALSCLDGPLLDVVDRWRHFIARRI